MLQKKLLDYYKLCDIKNHNVYHPVLITPINVKVLKLNNFFTGNKVKQHIIGANDDFQIIIV